MLGAEPFGNRRCLHARCPYDCARLDALGADRYAGAVAIGHARAEPDFHPKLLERVPRLFRKRRIEWRKKARRRLDQDDACGPRVDRMEIGRQCALGQFRDGARHLHAGRPAPDHDEIQEPPPLGGIGLGLGPLEGEQDTPADVGRVVDGLEAGRTGCPVVAEIGVLSAGCDDQVVKRNASPIRHNLPAGGINSRNLRQDDIHIVLATKDAANRRRDISGRERCRRHLIEQGLEEVVVVLIDNGHAERGAGKLFGGRKASKAGSNDDHPGASGGRVLRHSDSPGRYKPADQSTGHVIAAGVPGGSACGSISTTPFLRRTR